MKRAASPGLMEFVAEDVDPEEVITEIVDDLLGAKRQRTEEEICLYDG